jgi:hypothetical protein
MVPVCEGEVSSCHELIVAREQVDLDVEAGHNAEGEV